MASVCFYFQIHQPYRLRRYSVFDTDRHYFDEYKNAEICRKVAAKCYIPANQLMLETIKHHDGRFRISYSITGVALEQFERYAPEVIESLQQLSATGCVEFLDETYYHSLAFLYSRDEFRAQIEKHRAKIGELFGQQPRVFRNTELIYNNDLAHFHQPHGLRRDRSPRGRIISWGRAAPICVLSPAACAEAQAAAQELPPERRHRVSFQQPRPGSNGR